MSEVLDLEEIVQKGLRTEAFRDSKEYRDSFVIVATNLVHAFLNVEATDEEVLRIRRQYQTLDAVDRQLSSAIEDGILAQAELKRMEDD